MGYATPFAAETVYDSFAMRFYPGQSRFCFCGTAKTRIIEYYFDYLELTPPPIKKHCLVEMSSMDRHAFISGPTTAALGGLEEEDALQHLHSSLGLTYALHAAPSYDGDHGSSIMDSSTVVSASALPWVHYSDPFYDDNHSRSFADEAEFEVENISDAGSQDFECDSSYMDATPTESSAQEASQHA